MLSPKLRGLAYLTERFRELTLDCQFVSRSTPTDSLDMSCAPGTKWRVRTGRLSGSEMSTPYGTFENIQDALKFLALHTDRDPSVVGVLHRVDPWYFNADRVGSLLVSDSGAITIELQKIDPVLVADLHSGKGQRPRDWPAEASFKISADADLEAVGPKMFHWLEDLQALVDIGRQIHQEHRSREAVVRFNLYRDRLLVLDDFRFVNDFVGDAP